MTPAKQHFLRESARLQNQAAADADLESLPMYQKLRVNLEKDKAAVRLIESIKDKALAKAQLLPQYAEWMQGVLKAEQPALDDEVFTTCLVWMIDTGALDEATPLVEFAIEKGFQAGDQYQRSLPTLLVEQIAEQIQLGGEIHVENLDSLIKLSTAKTESGTHKVDMPDQVRAKFLKAAGSVLQEAGEKTRALELYKVALSYYDKVGVKQLIKELESAA
ncbi:phage terminase small subunit [Neisseria sp. S1]|uniref:phage terminase small subunit n=1 Tax=Neisseria sp. S1 TaxID=3318354 RepID=UPI003A8C6527